MFAAAVSLSFIRFAIRLARKSTLNEEWRLFLGGRLQSKLGRMLSMFAGKRGEEKEENVLILCLFFADADKVQSSVREICFAMILARRFQSTLRLTR